MKAQLPSVKNLVPDLVCRTLSAIDTPRALAVWLLFSYGEHDQLLKLEMPKPESYDSVSSFADDYQATCLLQKYPHLQTSFDRKEVAIKKFWAAEEQCRQTNRRILNMSKADGAYPSRFYSILHRAAEKAKEVLGPLNMNQIIDSCGWGPGVSSSCKGGRTSVYNKFQAKPEATSDLIACGLHHLVNAWHPWGASLTGARDDETGVSLPVSVLPSVFHKRHGNKLAFVPKNAKTDRSIAVEPHINSFLQKGIGSVMRSRMRKFGIDLDHGQDRNRHFARLGSIDGRFSTVDLSSASDTVAIELVRALLPADWFTLMDNARSKLGVHEGKWFRYHKFSSMGNGFTFELETLIFWCLSLVIVDDHGLSSGDLAVYGDDIIVPTQCTEEVLDVLAFSGFTPNPDKTFTQGPFRESCGKDYFRGTLVRPFFLKEEVTDVFSIFRVANAIRRYSAMRCSGLGCDGRFRSVWNFLFRKVPKSFQLRIPDGYGDGGFASNFDETNPTTGSSLCPAPLRAKDGVEGFLVRMWVSRPASARVERLASAFLYSTLSSREAATNGRFTVSNGSMRHGVKLVLVQDWSDLGPWL